AGAAQGTAAGAVPTSATTGAVSFTNPTSGNSYLARLFATSSVAGTLILYDRLVHTSTLSGTVTTAQTVASVALTRPDANGVNAELFMEVYTALGATSTTITGSYTNQAGTAGHTTTAATIPSNAPAGFLLPMPLAAGDTGIQTVASVTLAASTLTAGNFGVTIARRIAEFAIPAVQQPYPPQDPFWAGLPQIYNSACIFGVFVIGSGTAAPAISSASYVIAQG
ncbi:MAG TPA: hypothetical protein VGR57_00160, partial [Ktedonobacterales bacterium]|nr:hypothetical protein [Ktedonobacterales bacterium]